MGAGGETRRHVLDTSHFFAGYVEGEVVMPEGRGGREGGVVMCEV